MYRSSPMWMSPNVVSGTILWSAWSLRAQTTLREECWDWTLQVKLALSPTETATSSITPSTKTELAVRLTLCLETSLTVLQVRSSSNTQYEAVAGGSKPIDTFARVFALVRRDVQYILSIVKVSIASASLEVSITLSRGENDLMRSLLPWSW